MALLIMGMPIETQILLGATMFGMGLGMVLGIFFILLL